MVDNSIADQRRSPRRRVLWSGALVFERGAKVIPCVIQSISERGAKVRIGSSEHVPGDDVCLLDEKNRIGYAARIVWRRPTQFRMEFEQSAPLDGPLPRDMRFLRTI